MKANRTIDELKIGVLYIVECEPTWATAGCASERKSVAVALARNLGYRDYLRDRFDPPTTFASYSALVFAWQRGQQDASIDESIEFIYTVPISPETLHVRPGAFGPGRLHRGQVGSQ